MRELRTGRFAAILSDHRVMGFPGMAVGAVLCLQSPVLAMCATRPPGSGLVPLVSLHLREHLAMYAGMALGNLVSVVVAASSRSEADAWWRESFRGARCFLLMSMGMMLGSVVVAEMSITWSGALGLTPPMIGMIAGMLLAVVAEHFCQSGSYSIFQSMARPRVALGAGALDQ